MNDGMPQPIKIQLTIEQEFQLKLAESAIPKMSEAQAKDLLLQAARLLAMKDCVIRSLMKGEM